MREGREGATSEEEDSAPTATLIVLAHARKQFLFFLFVFWWMGGTVYCCVCACVSAEGRNAITDAHVPTRAILYVQLPGQEFKALLFVQINIIIICSKKLFFYQPIIIIEELESCSMQ